MSNKLYTMDCIFLNKEFIGQISGGARRDRTADLNTASVALSQLSYSPNKERRNNQTICNVNIITLPQIFLVT